MTDEIEKINQRFTVVLTNARSLMPKVNSLIDTLDELSADVAVVTETWIRANEGTEEIWLMWPITQGIT